MKLAIGSVAVLTFAALAVPATAQQHESWLNYCTVGSLRFCASVDLTLERFGTDSTSVAVRVRNLEGTYGNTPWRLVNPSFNSLETSLVAPDPGGDSRFLFTPPATLTGSAGYHVDIDPALCAVLNDAACPNDTWGWSEWTSWWGFGPGSSMPNDPAGFYWDIGAGPRPTTVIGCDDPGLSEDWGSFQTCGEGWIGYSFTLPGSWTLDDSSYLAWSGTDASGNEFGCVVGTNCFQATPEPISIALMGTGLAGIGAFRRRKRRSDRRF